MEILSDDFITVKLFALNESRAAETTLYEDV